MGSANADVMNYTEARKFNHLTAFGNCHAMDKLLKAGFSLIERVVMHRHHAKRSQRGVTFGHVLHSSDVRGAMRSGVGRASGLFLALQEMK
jgi:hypothetical protein